MIRAAWVCALVVLLTALIAHEAFDGFPNSGDEYSYLFQAQLFASGRLSSASPPEELRSSLQLDHVISDGTMRSKYFPGWSAVLTLGVWVGLPWLVTPVIAGIACFAIYGCLLQLSGKAPALFGAACVVGSPFFLLNGANYQPHMFALALAATTTACAARAQLSKCWAVGSGLAWGALVCARPIDAVLIVPVLVYLFRACRWWKAALLVALPLVAALLLYDKLQFGSFLRSGYDFYQPTLQRLYAAEGPDLAFDHVLLWRPHVRWLGDYAEWLTPAVFLAPIGLRLASVEVRRIVALLSLPVLTEVAFLKSFAGDSDGPRYLFLLVLPAAMLVAELARALEAELVGGMRGLAAVLLSTWLVASPSILDRVSERVTQIEQRRRVYQLSEQQHLSNALVLLGRTDVYPAHWFVRNGPDLNDAVLYAAECDAQTRQALQRWRPKRRFYRYVNERHSGYLRLLPLNGAPLASSFASCPPAEPVGR